MLIYLQRPDATLVAGYRKWQALGRQVRKGEKSIQILAPIIKRNLDPSSAEPLAVLLGFRSAWVFDVSQTDGEPLPELPGPVILNERGESIQAAITLLERFARARGCSIQYGPLDGQALGKFTVNSQGITVRSDLPQLQMLKTLVHEVAHALMHNEVGMAEVKRHRLELEAESCAFLVCHALGLDTSAYTFAYLALWLEAPKELLAAGERAAKAASEILEALHAKQSQVLEDPAGQARPFDRHERG